MEPRESWEHLNARAEEIVDRTTRMKRRQLTASGKGGTKCTAGSEQQGNWYRLLSCPTIPVNGSYEDFKILAETFHADVGALMDMHR